MSTIWNIAGVQMDVLLGEIESNLNHMDQFFQQAVAKKARLIIFPECAVTGYGYDSRDQAVKHAQLISPDSTVIDFWKKRCAQHNVYVVFGTLENDADKLYNTAALVGPQGLIARYRKIHLPFIGADRFTDSGNEPFEVYQIENLKIGLNICYDSSFPESARLLALKGADLIILPTNWPPGAECQAHFSINTRAMENTVYYAAVNRVGLENGCQFIGASSICDPLGNSITTGDNSTEQILYAQINPELSRQKLRIRIPKISAVSRIGDRRPEFYSQISEPNKFPTSRDEML